MKLFFKYGLIIGISTSLWLLLAFPLVKMAGIPAEKSRALSGLFSILILVLGIYFGLKEARKKNSGILPYKTALITGIKISIVTACIVAIFSFLYCTIINPGFVDLVVRETERSLAASGVPAEEILRKVLDIKQQYSTSMQVIQSLVGQFVLGTIASLIIALFLKTK